MYESKQIQIYISIKHATPFSLIIWLYIVLGPSYFFANFV